MSKSRSIAASLRICVIPLLGLALVVANSAGLGLTALPAEASALATVPGNSVMVPAGASASLQVRGIALQPGAGLPTGPLSVAQPPLATDRVRTTLYYGIDWGYAASDPQQVALAVWWAASGNWNDPSHSIAERITGAAVNSPGTPSWNPDGRSILTLMGQGQLTLSTLSLAAIPASASVGDGTLSVHNSSGQDILAFLPYGTVFTGPSGQVLVWATGVGENPNLGGATSTPETVSASPTPTGAAPPTDTPQVAAPTQAIVYKSGYTPVAQVTPSPAPKQPSATAEPAGPTDTPAPAPSDTPFSTNTPVPQPTNTPVPPTATSTHTPGPPPVAPNRQIDPPQQSEGQGVGLPPGSLPAKTPALPEKQQPQSNVASVPLLITPSGSPASDATAPAPPPVGTGTLPSPVSTGAVRTVGPTPPGPQLTFIAPLPTKIAKNTLTPTTGIVPGPVILTPTNVPTRATSPSDTGQPTPLAKPTLPPKPIPAPVAPTPKTEPGGPVINTAPGNPSDNGAAAGSGSQTNPKTKGQAPNSAPVTGAGASLLPLWLSICSTLMVLGGWALRRMAPAAREAQKLEDQ